MREVKTLQHKTLLTLFLQITLQTFPERPKQQTTSHDD